MARLWWIVLGVHAAVLAGAGTLVALSLTVMRPASKVTVLSRKPPHTSKQTDADHRLNSLSYTSLTILRVGESTELKPQNAVTGATYTVATALPPNFDLDAATGIVSGTAVALWPRTEYTVTRTLDTGESMAVKTALRIDRKVNLWTESARVDVSQERRMGLNQTLRLFPRFEQETVTLNCVLVTDTRAVSVLTTDTGAVVVEAQEYTDEAIDVVLDFVTTGDIMARTQLRIHVVRDQSMWPWLAGLIVGGLAFLAGVVCTVLAFHKPSAVWFRALAVALAAGGVATCLALSFVPSARGEFASLFRRPTRPAGRAATRRLPAKVLQGLRVHDAQAGKRYRVRPYRVPLGSGRAAAVLELQRNRPCAVRPPKAWQALQNWSVLSPGLPLGLYVTESGVLTGVPLGSGRSHGSYMLIGEDPTTDTRVCLHYHISII